MVLCPLNDCPFKIFKEFYELVTIDKNKEQLRTSNFSLYRGVTNSSIQPKFSSQNLGLNTMRDTFKFFNNLLPNSLKVERPTGHSGRRTMATIAVNNSCNPTVVALATKHRDPKTLKHYVKPNDNLQSAAGLLVSESIGKKRQLLPDYEEDVNNDVNINDDSGMIYI